MKMETDIRAGTKVRTLYDHSETGTVLRPRKESLPKPGPDWFLVRFDHDGGKLYIHREMFAVSNQ